MEESSLIRLTEYRLFASRNSGQGIETEVSFLYRDYPQVRDAARRILFLIGRHYTKELFEDICTRCGNCCRNRPVEVSAREIMEMSLFLKMSSEERFRKKYVNQAFTWVRGDGLLKTINGRCVFLSTLSTGRACCAVYQVRPRACSTFTGTAVNICEKSPEEMIYHVESVFLHGDIIKVMTRAQKSVEIPVREPDLLKVLEFIQEKTRSILEDSAVECSHPSLQPEKAAQELFEHGEGMRESSDDERGERKDDETGDDTREPSDCISGSESVLLEAVEGFSSLQKPYDLTIAKKTEGLLVTGMRVQKKSLTIIGSHNGKRLVLTFEYREHPSLLAGVRGIMDELSRSETREVRHALWHVEPSCFRCGICCRNYAVEISPTEIERIAGYLRISIKSMWKKYMRPGQFTWNQASGIISKVADLSHEETLVCTFLQKKAPGIYLCSVYKARPDVCREYSPHGDKCRAVTWVKKWETLAANVYSIDFVGASIRLTTAHTERHGLPPPVIPLEESGAIKKIYSAIVKEIEEILFHLPSGKLCP